jgi:hypothetical protein
LQFCLHYRDQGQVTCQQGGVEGEGGLLIETERQIETKTDYRGDRRSRQNDRWRQSKGQEIDERQRYRQRERDKYCYKEMYRAV